MKLFEKEKIVSFLFLNRNIDLKNGCWNWERGKVKKEYGVIYFQRHQYLVHRISAMIFLGFDIDSSLCVCHSCDNPSCFNPDHLFIGTQQDNLIDAYKKERNAKGEKVGTSKLKNEDIFSIRSMFNNGIPQYEIIKKFHMSHCTISNICKNKTWKHLLNKSLCQ